MTKLIPFILGLLLFTTAQAHQQQAAMTNILFNSRSGLIEISHRLYLHDAEHAMKLIYPEEYDLFTSNKARDNLTRYVAEHFFLTSSKANTSNQAKVIGGEIEGKFFWVYQETPIPESYQQGEELLLSIKNTILMDVFNRQKNIVNIEHDGQTDALVFDKESGLLSKKLRK